MDYQEILTKKCGILNLKYLQSAYEIFFAIFYRIIYIYYNNLITELRLNYVGMLVYNIIYS